MNISAADFHAARERLARLNIERQFATGKMREHLDNAAAILQRQLGDRFCVHGFKAEGEGAQPAHEEGAQCEIKSHLYKLVIDRPV